MGHFTGTADLTKAATSIWDGFVDYKVILSSLAPTGDYKKFEITARKKNSREIYRQTIAISRTSIDRELYLEEKLEKCLYDMAASITNISEKSRPIPQLVNLLGKTL